MTTSAGPALKELYRQYGEQIAFLTLYVREAHPGEKYPQPRSLLEKVEHARAYQSRDGISWPVAVDDIDGPLHRRLDNKPNSAYLIDAAGAVVFRLLWSNDTEALREALDAVAAGYRPAVADRQGKLVPLLRGTGEMHRTLSLAGNGALRDVLFSVPPMYAVSWLASRFRGLSPLGRSVAAGGVAAAGLAVVGSLAYRAWRRRHEA